MRRLAIVPLLVLGILGLGAVIFYVVQTRSSTSGVPVGTAPPVAGNTPLTPPPTEPLPGAPPETPEAEKNAPLPDASTAPAIPSDVQNLPSATAATTLLKGLPLPPPPSSTPGAPELVLASPIENLHPRDIQDMFNQGREGGRTHEATDILAPRNTPVKAVADGTITKLFLSKPGGITIYQFDPTSTYCYYYAHLDHYAPNLKEGMTVKRGDVIGFVGTSGNADARTPHLHFAIFELLPDKKWWHGKPVNPYSYLLRAVAAQ